jgi:hypothetical protein
MGEMRLIGMVENNWCRGCNDASLRLRMEIADIYPEGRSAKKDLGGIIARTTFVVSYYIALQVLTATS